MITRWVNQNTVEYVITSTYAEGKGYLFNLFFGWRQTHKDNARFTLSRKDWKIIDEMIEYYYTFVKPIDKFKKVWYTNYRK